MEQAEERYGRQRRSRQQILQLLEEFKKSGATVKDFCRRHSISTANFHKWRSRYRSKAVSKNNPSGFATVDIVSPHLASQRLFAEVGQVKIYQPVAASYLKELLQ